MAKTFLFIRGPKAELRNKLVENLRRDLTGAVWIAMDQVAEDPKKAHATCIGAVKQALQAPGDTMIAIDNESMKPIHWQAYYAVAERKNVQASVIGIDVFDDSNEEQKNLQLENSALFIALVDKYWCVKTNLDAQEVEVWFKTMKGNDNATDSGTASDSSDDSHG